MYAYFSFFVQFLVPSLIVAVAYARIYFTFKASSQNMNISVLSATAIRKKNRRRKTNILLTLISVIFFVSWAPLNIFTVVTNTTNIIEVEKNSAEGHIIIFLYQDEKTLVLIFGVCHLVGMTTAVTNPIFYVWLNNNFKCTKSCSSSR